MYKIYNKYVFVNIKIMGDIKAKKYVIGSDSYNSFCFLFAYKKYVCRKIKKVIISFHYLILKCYLMITYTLGVSGIH